VAVSAAGELDAEALLTRADAAMYRTKRHTAVGAASVVL
jgi:GGDEF domain-containing protein